MTQQNNTAVTIMAIVVMVSSQMFTRSMNKTERSKYCKFNTIRFVSCECKKIIIIGRYIVK